tara:strand:- start:4118 stop:5338 length:1221 start_codon:yes stop_codon:yes gene_type:complete
MVQTRLFSDGKKENTNTKSEETIKNKFTSSIWSFSGTESDNMYRWYGTIPKQLLQKILEMYCSKNSQILEPFSGMGTTLEVAVENELKITGMDSNPLACLITETKIHDIPSKSKIVKYLDAIYGNMEDISSEIKKNKKEWRKVLLDSKYDYTKKWFREDTLDAILLLLFRISNIKQTDIQRIFFVVASNIVREVASVDPRCTHHLVTKKKPFIDPFPIFREKILKIIPEVSEKRNNENIHIKQRSIFNNNFRKNSFNFVLAHPPYLGMIHYHLIHRLATDLLDIVNFCRIPKSLKKYSFDYEQIKQFDISTDNSEKYYKFIEDFASLMSSIIENDGRCCIIIGDQRHKQHLRHPFTDFIFHFEKNGFVLEENFIWVLQNNGGMHVLRRGNFIDHNYILVFHKTSSK